MKITLIDQPLNIDAARTFERSPGLHASEIYGDLFQDLEPNRFKRDSEPNPIKMAVGLAWEQWLERTLQAMGELVSRPEELMSEEGIAYSPDLLVLNGKDRIGEIKATWMSSTGAPTDPKFDKWLVQMKLYCYWTTIPDARLYGLFMCGNYKDIRDPQFLVWDISFTDMELRENHAMNMGHARHKGLLK